MSELDRSAEIEFKLANAWRRKGNIARAVAGYRKAIALRPEYIPAYLELADILETTGELDEAIDLYQRALERNPKELALPEKLSRLLHRKTRRFDPAGQPATPVPSSAGQRGHILFYSDRPGIMGAEQINHVLMCALATAGYRVTCAQYKTFHYLIEERERAGIHHEWISVNDMYDVGNLPRALDNSAESQEIFTRDRPALIIFGDGCPFSSLAAKLTALRMTIPYIALVHCVTALWAKKFAAHLTSLELAYQHAQKIVAVSYENLKLLQQSFRLEKNKGTVIYNGRPAVYFSSPDAVLRQRWRQQLGIPSEAVVGFTSARMDFVKGYQHQIDAMKALRGSDIWPRLYFVWAGTGGFESRIRAMALEADVDDHIKFLGERADVAELLNVADMFILPSYFEGMPLSVMEAMAKGLPVMASAVSGVPEELGVTGKLLPNPELDSDDTLKQMVATIWSWTTDRQLRKEIGRQCKQRAENEFRMERMLTEYLRLVDRTLVAQSNCGVS